MRMIHVRSGRSGRAGEASAAPRPARRMAAIGLLLVLGSGALAAPANAATQDDDGGRGAVSIGVQIAPLDACSAVRPPCKCGHDGTPTLPPGLAKKKGALPPGLAKREPGWCG